MKYNWKIVLQSKHVHQRNIRTSVKTSSITDVITRLRNVKLLIDNNIVSITRTPLS